MRIGVGLIGYECAANIGRCLSPWIRTKQAQIDEIKISLVHGVFPEVAALGCPVESKDFTHINFINLKKDLKVDHALISPCPMKEHDLRTIGLKALGDIDIFWLLDHDEYYTIQEINDIINFVEANPDINTFKVNFKNYVIKPNWYVKDFVAPRIWRNAREFYYDNDVIFNDDKLASDLPSLVVPVNPRHESWIGTPEYLKRKVEFQKLHYKACSFKWNDQTNYLELNNDYYYQTGKEIPEIHED